MKNKVDESILILSKLNNTINNETRLFGKPLTNTYRNQEYINYLKRREPCKNIKNVDFIQISKNLEKKNEKMDHYYDRRMRIDELYEETRYKNHPQYNIEYIREVTIDLKKTEMNNIPDYGFLRNQPTITEKMRSYLVDWLVDVHSKFNLVSETLFLTINLMDRFLSRTVVEKKEYQLVAISSMLISCKYEEIYFPEIRDFIYITDKSFTKDEIIKMESKILDSLEFEIHTISAFRFLERFSLSLEKHLQSFYLAQYFLELSLIDNKLDYPSSMKSTSAIVISRKILNLNPDYPDNLQKASGYAYEMLRNCIKDFCSIIESSKRSILKAVKNKFAAEKYMEVSTIYVLN